MGNDNLGGILGSGLQIVGAVWLAKTAIDMTKGIADQAKDKKSTEKKKDFFDVSKII